MEGFQRTARRASLMLAHGSALGLASVAGQRVSAGREILEVAALRITAQGWKALAKAER
jgi:hypothetical protein